MGSYAVFLTGASEGLGNPEVNAVPETYPAEGSNANANTERSTTSGYPYWPRQTPAENIPTLPETEINSEPVPTNEGNNKKVRIKGHVEVKKIIEGGLEKNDDVLIEAGPKNKLQPPNKKDYNFD